MSGRLAAWICVFTAVAACARDPIVWDEAHPLMDKPRHYGWKPSVPLVARQCRQTVRVARDFSDGWYATWWAVRPDSTSDLVVARSSDNKQWSAPVRVDTTDTGPLGCGRVAPSIAADSGNVHVAYFMVAAEGAGIFVAHSMDRGAMFHTPVAIVYGARAGRGRTAIRALGNLVAVAYEDPNSDPPRVGLALSSTMAHLFDWRGLVSPETGEASDPEVFLDQRSVAVDWARGADSTPRMRRVGHLNLSR